MKVSIGGFKVVHLVCICMTKIINKINSTLRDNGISLVPLCHFLAAWQFHPSSPAHPSCQTQHLGRGHHWAECLSFPLLWYTPTCKAQQPQKLYIYISHRILLKLLNKEPKGWIKGISAHLILIMALLFVYCIWLRVIMSHLHDNTYNLLPATNAASACSSKQRCATSPLDGDCALPHKIHHALRFQTKQSIIMLFFSLTKRQIHAQTASWGRSFIRISDEHEEICANFKLTRQVHLFLVLTVSLKTGCLPGYKQVKGQSVHQSYGKHGFVRWLCKLNSVLIRLILRYNVLVLTHVQHWIKVIFSVCTEVVTTWKVNNNPSWWVLTEFDFAPNASILFQP